MGNISCMYRAFIYFIMLQFVAASLYGQFPDPCCKPILEKGQIILVQTDMNNNSFQTAGAQVINFKVNGSVIHRYTVTNIEDNRTTLHHEMLAIQFSFEGMGQKKIFDSNNEEDMKGPFGPYFKDLLSRFYDIVIDTTGQTKSLAVESKPVQKPDENILAIIDMLKPLTKPAMAAFAPDNFFAVLPVYNPYGRRMDPLKVWSQSTDGDPEKSTTTYTLSSFNDSTALVDVQKTGITNTKSERMGRVTKTSLKIEEKGKIVVDRKTGILKEHTSTIDSNGTTEAMGGTVPVNGKMSLMTSVSFLRPKESR